MLGTLDSQVIEKFKEFQKKNGKYCDLDIENVKFNNLSVDSIFDIVRRGASPRPIKQYQVDKDYSGLKYNWLKIGDVTKSNIYLRKTNEYINEDGKNNSVLGKKGDFLITNSMTVGVPIILDIETCFHDGFLYLGFNDNVQEKYYNLYLFYFFTSYRQTLISKSKDGIVKNLNTDIIKTVSIPIPQDYNENYKSIDIQKAMVEFLEYNFNNLEQIKSSIDKRYNIVTKIKKSLIPSTFKRTAIKNTFKKYAKENNIDFDITDIKFDIKQIFSKNGKDTICTKRMGFTPKTDNNGNINWFSVSDLTNQDGLYIDLPNSTKKTTMKLIKEQVDSNNTGKSEKLIPIKKGDILVSFKLTVGTVKIYNSDLPAYCNEAIDILTLDENYDNKYIAYNCILEYPKYGTKTNNGITLNDEDKSKIKVFIPKDLDNYTSYELQQILANFIEQMNKRIDEKYFKKYNRFYKVLELLRETYLKRTFSKIVWS